jgi:manganese transport protein
MEGFLNFRMRPWLRRLITRSLAIVPAAITIYVAGSRASFGLLLLSQAILSMQLPFAIIPLIHFTSDRARMGEFASPRWVRILAWITAVVIVGLNLRLAYMSIDDWLATAGPWRTAIWAAAVPLAILLVALMVWVALEPRIARRRRGRAPITLPEPGRADAAAAPSYHSILLPLDHTALDGLAVNHAAAMARIYGAKVYLLHVEEGVTSQIYGPAASTAEVEAGEQYLERIAQSLRQQGIAVETAISHSSSPRKAIVRYAERVHPDLVIMGAHGHGGLKDLIFGNTINPVRHNLAVPMLIVRPGKT